MEPIHMMTSCTTTHMSEGVVSKEFWRPQFEWAVRLLHEKTIIMHMSTSALLRPAWLITSNHVYVIYANWLQEHHIRDFGGTAPSLVYCFVYYNYNWLPRENRQLCLSNTIVERIPQWIHGSNNQGWSHRWHNLPCLDLASRYLQIDIYEQWLSTRERTIGFSDCAGHTEWDFSKDRGWWAWDI